jgi:hypothetical protein
MTAGYVVNKVETWNYTFTRTYSSAAPNGST